MDALMLLTADHNRVRGLFAKFKAAHESEDVAEQAVVAQKILTELQVHTTIEEQVFYPAVRAADEELHELVTEGVEEHHVVDVLAAEIKALAPEVESWAAKVTVLIENVEHHAEEEETEMFPEVKKAFAAAALEELGQQLEKMKGELGAPTASDKEHLTTEQLHELATAQEIPGRSSMKRDELLATVAPA